MKLIVSVSVIVGGGAVSSVPVRVGAVPGVARVPQVSSRVPVTAVPRGEVLGSSHGDRQESE